MDTSTGTEPRRAVAQDDRDRHVTIVLCHCASMASVVALVLSMAIWGGERYLTRGQYDPIDAIALLAVLMSIPLYVASTLCALALGIAALVRFIRAPVIHRPLRRHRLMAVIAISAALIVLAAWTMRLWP